MNCIACEKNNLSFQKYIIHIEYAHKISNYYKCPVDNCFRLYNRRDVFKKHVFTKHSEYFKPKQKSDFNTHVSSPNLPSDKPIIKKAEETEDETNKKPREFDESIQLTKFMELLRETVINLIARLYGNMGLNRSVIQNLIDTFSLFLKSGFLDIIRNFCMEIINNTESDSLKCVIHMFDILENAFEPFNTEFKRFKYFQNSKRYIIPTEQILGVSDDQKRQNKEKIFTLKRHCAYLVPMQQTLKYFLEVPGVFDKILSFQEKLLENFNDENPCITHLLHGSLWQKIKKSFPGNQIILPIIVYFDDFESLNPLGSHAGCYKIGSVYFSIATIPPEYISRLENIFLSLIFYSGDRHRFGNQKTFHILLKELIFLEKNGVDVTYNNGNSINVKFCMVFLTGDNLGVHTLLGLNESFASNFYCRFCVAPKAVMRTQTLEDTTLLRLPQKYEEHLDKKLGVKETCIWNELPNFHIYENMCCDIMHDIFEGVLRYDMALIIKKLIEKDHFTLDRLNSRIKYCIYDVHEKNVCPGINKDHLSNGCLIMSASEMSCLTRNFAYIIGDLVPENCDIWKFYLVVLELVHILTSSTFTKPILDYLKSLIEEHNESYVTLSGQHLKPKFHFLIHYPRIILDVGPPILLSCMRFEAKHKDLKTVSQSTSCRKNLPLSLANRNQLKFCYRLIASEGFDDKVNIGKVSNIDYNLKEFLVHFFNPDTYFCTPFFEYNGIKYETDGVLLYDTDNDLPVFCQIKSIFISDSLSSHNVYFHCLVIKAIDYLEHLYAYKVKVNKDSFKVLEASLFFSQFPTILRTIKNDLLITKLCTN